VIFVGGFGYYLADSAGKLPWQEDPTRIAITPFADIPGFGAAATATTGP
jgi:predicted metal-binding protein